MLSYGQFFRRRAKFRKLQQISRRMRTVGYRTIIIEDGPEDFMLIYRRPKKRVCINEMYNRYH